MSVEPQNNIHYIFFYGTLCKNGVNHSRIANCADIRYIGRYTTENKYSFLGLSSGAFPYASEYSFGNYGKVNIDGELYEITQNKDLFLHNIDQLEYNYTRHIASINMNGIIVDSYIYLLTDPELIRDIEPNIRPNGKGRFVYIDDGVWP